MQLFRFAALCGLMLVVSNLRAEEDKYLKAFPAAKEGMSRFVIQLPHRERDEEGQYRVELIVGQTIETDGVNQYFLGGKLVPQPLKGWGFTYYEVTKLGPAGSTRMGVPPGTPPVTKFVAGPREMISYNSRVPIVIYVPKDAEVQYRIFMAGDTMPVEKG